MNDTMPDPVAGPCTEITVRLSGELARLVEAGGEVERRVVEALALDEFRRGRLSRAELRRLLGFGARSKLDQFLAEHSVFGTYTTADPERGRRDLDRLGF